MASMGLRLRQGAAAFAALWAMAASAQSALTETPGPSAFDCLVRGPAGSAPVFPERELQFRSGALVRVRLTFDRPDAAPKTKIFYNSGADVFGEAVERHLDGYRLPCLRDGANAVATQEFVFDPTDGRKVVSSRERAEPSGPSPFACVQGMRPPLPPTPRPGWSSSHRDDYSDGNVIVGLRFVGPAEPPEMTVVFDGGQTRLADAVRHAVASYRLPCMKPGDGPVHARQVFGFYLEGRTRYALNDLTLATFAGAIEPGPQRGRFDFSTMGCPFDLRFSPLRPHAENIVGELERSDPNRREFIEWLKTVVFKLPPHAARFVTGNTFTLSVPCAVLDLN